MSKVDERNANQTRLDIKDLLNSDHGRRFIWRMMGYCGIYRDVDTSLSVEEIMKQLGKRQVGLYLLGILSDVDDESVLLMMREAKNKETEDTYARAREQDIIDRDNDENSDYGGTSHNYSGDALSDYF